MLLVLKDTMHALFSEKLPVGLTRLGRPVSRLSAINAHISVTPLPSVALIYSSSDAWNA